MSVVGLMVWGELIFERRVRWREPVVSATSDQAATPLIVETRVWTEVVRDIDRRFGLDGELYCHPMKLVSWNTNARPDAGIHLADLLPDVAVLPEWGKLPLAAPVGSSSFAGFGQPGKRGIGVAGWRDWSVRAANVEPLPNGVVGAIEVDGPTSFKLIAVWPYLSKTLPINPVSQALELWSDWIDFPLVVAGDFNTGSAWEHEPTFKHHPPLVEQLAGLGLRSAYHDAHGVTQGVGEAITFWDHRWKKGHMIDHIFVPNSWQITEFKVGDVDVWLPRSDHMPLIADLDPSRPAEKSTG